MAALASQWHIEVPLTHSRHADAPLVQVPGGEAAFPLRQLPEGAARAGKSEAAQCTTTCSRALVWQLDAAAPAELLLAEVAVNEERRDGSVRLAFSAPLLPSISCVDASQGGGQGTRLSAVTADGALHTLHHRSSASSSSSAGPGTAAGASASAPGSGTRGLAHQLATPGAITSVSLALLFQRAGAPTAVLEVGGWTCIGTEEGNIVALPAGGTDPAAAVVLAPTSGISKMLGGLFGRTGGQAVCQLAELRHMEHRLLCAIHEGGQLRLWDLPTRRLVHTADLLPAHLHGGWVPALARLTGEPLDASTSILLVYFEPAPAADGAAAAAAADEPGMLATYELFLEQRGEGAYKVLLEAGQRMQSGVHRLLDLALENVALHTVGAWLLYDDAQGRRHVHCVPVSFADGPVEPADVQLLEAQLLEGCHANSADLAIEEEAWRTAESQLSSAAGSSAPPPAAIGAAFADAVLAPGRLSRPALHAALGALGSGVPREAVLGADLADLKQQLPRWVAAIPAAAAAAGAGSATLASPAAATLARWSALLAAYGRAWQDAHLPLALLQLPPQGDSGALLMLLRRGGLVTALRPAAAPELALHDALPGEWQQAAAQEAHQAGAVLEAAAALFKAAGGGQLARLVWACLQEGLDVGSTVLPALVRSVAAGAAAPPVPAGPSASGRLGFPGAAAAAAGSAGGAAGAQAQWRAACRQLPLQLARLCSSGSFAAAVEAALAVLGTHYVNAQRIRSQLPALTKPIRSAALATLAQVAWVQLQLLLQLALLLQYALWSHTLANWSLPAEDAAELEGRLLPRLMQLLQAAATAYWAAVAPLADGAGEAEGEGQDPAQLVVALRIGEGGPSGAAAAKRARLSQTHDSYVASLLLAGAASSQVVHVVRDLPDLQRISLLFAQHLLCLEPSPLHAAGNRRLQLSPAEERGQLTPADQAVDLCAALFRGRQSAQLAALQRLLPAQGGQDMRLLFFRACSRARQIALADSDEEKRRLEEESCGLFFRVAAVFGQEASFAGQAAAVTACVRQMLGDMSQSTEAVGEGAQAAKLQFYEALSTMYDRMGRHSAAARFALAAARQVAAALPRADQLQARQQQMGRLWTNVFACMMEAGRFEEAYAALLSNEVPEVQLDCLHRLVAGLCAAPGGVELLCRLPFAQNLPLVREGRQVWVPILQEAVATLERRAAQLDLRADPQPYKVLADFHICRSNYQAAAGAMLAYARRLVAECPEEPAQLAEAQRALATAVSCLSLVERQHAWVMDPAPPAEDGGGGGDGLDEPPVLTLAALQREYAIARGHAALAAAMPGGERGHTSFTGGGSGGESLRGGDAEDVFAQLLALGLHDDAFQLAEAAFVGTQLTRALERAFASLAAACVRQQVERGRAAAGGAGAAGASSADAMLARAGSDDMDTEDAIAGAAAGGAAAEGPAAGAARANGGGAVADWRRLKSWLARHEGGSHRFRLRLVILDAILRTEPSFMLPPWLMAALRPAAPSAPGAAAAAPSSSSADLAGALRVLMQHGRLADGASLAAAHLQAVLHSVPSVSMARTSQVYFPQALLDELLAQLGAQPGLAAERRRVADLCSRVRGAAAKQTPVIQQLFAH
ncbi:hypothetical protein ABPG75_010268 [Micractinium tetrahymenae]